MKWPNCTTVYQVKVNYAVVTNVLCCKYVSLYSDFFIEFTVSKVKLVLTKVSLVD